ncbi:hypothetical protein Trco_008191 [Trichoderma cornu-damae]|uniref:Phospholipase D/nuclease n=1 Tax=Trichoderma cornu-damae TaxID=654480 RepID=A0A9P8QDW5_9HYPO|nr:hypothetical protein Trco_008191 [Trichoderma cornu-damae]
MARPEGRLPELPDDADDDEALRYAIALSLQHPDSSAAAAAIVIDDSEDDGNEGKIPPASPPEPRQQAQPPSRFGSLLLDRKAMEQERLNRLAKRQRPLAGDVDDDDDDDDVVEIPPPKKQARMAPEPKPEPEPEPKPKDKPASALPPSSSSSSTSGTSSSTSTSSKSLPYPNGTVKRTRARGCARTGEEITIEEVFQKEQLELAVLSSFQWDEEWMVSKLDFARTKILLLAFAKDEAQKSAMRANVPANVKFCFPPMHGPGAMHSKLQLLKYPNYLRVVVPTGNLVAHDWGETGSMENMVFLIDLPRLDSPATHDNTASHSPTTRFYTELAYFLRATGVGEKMVASLSNYDFSETSDIGFVHTIPGSHSGETVERIGYCGLGASVAALGLASPDPVEVDLCASLGSINHELVGAIYNACRGDDGIDTHKQPGGASSGSAQRLAAGAKELRERFRIYFPTDHTVSRSRGGRNAGGTICVQAKWWRSPNFPRELVRDVITRDRLLTHSKMIFVRRRVGDSQATTTSTTTTTTTPGWAYVGSANLSESAW